MTALPRPVLAQVKRLRAQKDDRWRHLIVACNELGWSWDMLARNLGITRQSLWSSVAAVRASGADPGMLDGLPLPGPPAGPKLPPKRKRGRSPYKRREVPIGDLALLRGLWSLSAKRRGPTPPTAPSARAAAELKVVARRLIAEGFSVGDIAVAVGADVSAVRHRLLRAGVRASEIVREEG